MLSFILCQVEISIRLLERFLFCVRRDFLRLSNPLCCAIEDEDSYDAKIAASNASSGVTFAVDKSLPLLSEKTLQSNSSRHHQSITAANNGNGGNGGPVPLTRVKCLVSMTTPRDVRLHGAAITPAFVEFDLSAEGFGCLYLPSVAPQAPTTPSVVSGGMIGGTEPSVVGGIGAGNTAAITQSAAVTNAMQQAKGVCVVCEACCLLLLPMMNVSSVSMSCACFLCLINFITNALREKACSGI